jgi:quinoprotein glucose dehydrogenase
MLAILAAAAAGGWEYYGGDQGGTKYVEAAEITRENVDNLAPVWTYRTGHIEAARESARKTKFETTPVLVEDKLLLCSPLSVVIALNPATGEEIWRRDAKIDLSMRPGNAFNCRGVAYWRDETAAQGAPCAKRVFMATNDRRLLAADFRDGAACEGFGAGGEIVVDAGTTQTWPGETQITSAPVVVGDTVVVGSAISDNVNVAAPKGAVHAFDARTGALKWSFDPIPRDAQSAEALGWRNGVPTEGHANVWAPMSVDEARGLVFLPTSSPSPDFFGGYRPGDNRYANSIVALDGATGAMKWSFQVVHHDLWDYDVPAQPLLATITKDGVKRDVVVVLTKMGLVFTLDRSTGEAVFPIEERAVPQGAEAGESLSATQPFPSAPRPLSPSVIKPKDAWGLTQWDKGACAKSIGELRAEGLFTPPSVQGTIVYPFTGGGANWGGGAYDPQTNRLFVNTSSALHIVRLVPRAETDENWHDVPNGEQAPMRGAPYAMTRAVMLSPLGLPCNPPPWGELHAIDMANGDIVWESKLGTTEELAPFGVGLKTGTPNIGGPLVTASGLVFIGAAMDSYLRAFDAASGKELWQGKLPAGGQATPMSYAYEGRQYVVIAAGGHRDMGTKKGDYIVAYALPRAGEKGPSLASRFLDRPGRRFLLLTGLSALGVLVMLTAISRFFRRRR